MDLKIEIPEVLIAIVNYDGLDDTVNLLNNLKCLSYGRFSILVVDNGSKNQDGLNIIPEKFTDVSVLRLGRNTGFTGGCNAAFKFAMMKGIEYVLILNNDIEVSADLLEILIKVIESDSTIACVGPYVTNMREPHEILFSGGNLNLWTGRANSIIKSQEKTGTRVVDWIEGSCMLIRISSLENVGCMNDQFFIYYEELDLCYRFNRGGYKCVITSDTRIKHYVSKTVSRPFRTYMQLRNSILFMRMNARWYHWYTYLLVYLFYTAPRISGKEFIRNPVKTTSIIFRAIVWNFLNKKNDTQYLR